MTTVRLVHMITAFTLMASLLLRLVWMVTGNRFARWSAFIPTTRFQATEVFRQAAFYAFLRKEIPKVLGHNQLAAAAYLLLFVLLFVETVTGFALDALQGTQPWATLFGWVLDLLGPQLVRVIHHLSMWAILAIALFHVYSSVLVDHLEKNGLDLEHLQRLQVPDPRRGRRVARRRGRADRARRMSTGPGPLVVLGHRQRPAPRRRASASTSSASSSGGRPAATPSCRRIRSSSTAARWAWTCCR